jgi:hypothetical protein
MEKCEGSEGLSSRAFQLADAINNEYLGPTQPLRQHPFNGAFLRNRD